MRVLAFLLMSQVACATTYKDQRSKSAAFKDGQFHNPIKSAKSFWAFLRMRISTTYNTWPEWVDSTYKTISSQRVEGNEIHVTHINHSTVLLQVGGLNILTDPIYSERSSPFSWLGPKRVRNPGIRFEDLPPIDIVLVSHDHYDHLDLPTIQQLVLRDKPLIYAGLGVGRHLQKITPTIEMDWWESVTVKEKMKLHFVPVQHFSGRTLSDRNETLWGGFVIEISHRKIYFGGDTGYASHFTETSEKLGPVDIALLPIGAYEPNNFMGYAHINPEEAVQAHIDLRATTSIGIHYGTFQLTAESIDDPLKDLAESLRKKNIPSSQFLTPEFGETLKFNY